MARGFNVDASDFEAALSAIVEEFAEDARADARKAVRAGARACRDQLARTSPKDEGEYAAGWRTATEADSFGGFYVRVYNASKPSLTHLLEFGHELWLHGADTGRRSPARPHIAPAKDEGARRILEALR